jgi:hypothetical protein
MTFSTRSLVAAIALLVLPAAARAQSSDVTLRMPINLTQLSPDIERVRISCKVTSTAISNPGGEVQNSQFFTVAAGQVQAIATIVVGIPTLDNPAGKSASYLCWLMGWDRVQSRWDMFRPNSAHVAFRVSPSLEDSLTGSFDWVSATANAPPPPATTAPPPGGN